jgi:hypothetical protein
MFSIHPENLHCAYPVIKETIPKSSLGYNTNNKYPEFPPLMCDGRSVTASYQPETVINEKIIQDNNIQSNWEYRRFLSTNARAIMEENFREASNDNGYYLRHNNIIHGNAAPTSGSPFLYPNTQDNRQPFGYASSDLKEIYLSREQLNARKNVPTYEA